MLTNKNPLLIIVIVLVIAIGGYMVLNPKADPTQSENVPKTAADIPETAYGPAVPQDKGYLVEELGDGLYWVTEGAYQAMFLTTGKGVIVVDAPPSIGTNMLKAIAETTDEPITHVIYSHSHADHIAAASMYPKDAIYIAHEETAARLKREGPFEFGLFVGGSDVPDPTITFKNNYKLTVGSQTLELAYKGPSHRPGNILIYAKKQKVLMFIDVIFPGWTPFKWLAVAEDVPAFIDSHDWVLDYDFETLISGHVGRLGTREDVEMQKAYILDMQANAAKALQTVDFNAIATEVGYANLWLLFGTYLDAVGEECARLTEEQWGGKLAAVDVFTKSHCDKLAESLRID